MDEKLGRMIANRPLPGNLGTRSAPTGAAILLLNCNNADAGRHPPERLMSALGSGLRRNDEPERRSTKDTWNDPDAGLSGGGPRCAVPFRAEYAMAIKPD
jgi:hypothetical protein